MASKRSSISVVVPCHQAVSHARDALDSALGQTRAAEEVIVVNDGSPRTRELEALLRPYGPRIRYLRQANRGPGGARNAGIRAARGDLVAFLDSDDVWLSGFLEHAGAVLDAGQALDLVHADARMVGRSPNAGRTLAAFLPAQEAGSLYNLLAFRCVVHPSCALVRRSALLRAGGFDERFRRAEDWDLWVRLVHGGSRIGFVPRVLVHRRLHGESLTADGEAELREQAAVAGKLLDLLTSLTPAQRRLLEATSERAAARLQLYAGKRLLLEGRYAESREALEAAVAVLGRRRDGAMLAALRTTPALVRWAFAAYRRLRAAPG
jgi:GT2 family glycosyltransferase